MHLHPPNISKHFLCICLMECPKLCELWNLLGKLVTHEVFQAPCGCTLVSVPKARTRFPVVASMGLQKPHPTVASHTSLSMFNLISPLKVQWTSPRGGE